MSQSFQTPDATLTIPGAYPKITVQAAASNLSTTGVLMLVGEADAGPDQTLEADLTLNAFGPNQLADVVQKYRSGNLVDAFRGACAAANDPDIVGSFNSCILVKTNPSTKATSNLQKVNGGTYGTLADKSYGTLGNLIYYTVTAPSSETIPTTGAFTYIPPVGTVAYGLRVNGGAEVSRTTVTNETPTAFVAGTTALTGISCTGGVNRAALSSAHGQLAVGSIVGNSAVFTLSVIANWDTTPTVGDTLVIPSGSAIAGAGNANVGAYVITSISSTTITATKLSDAGKGGAVIGTITAPVTVAATNVVGANTDLVAYSPVTITQSSATMIDGVGKSLEINQLVTGTDLLNRTAFQLGTTTAVTWVSATGAAAQLVSASEYSVSLNTNRQLDNVQETLAAGGNIALTLGYKGTTATCTISATQLTTTVVGGSGSSLTLLLSQFPTLNDLAAFLNAQPGYVCAVGNAALGQFPSTTLDQVTGAGICTDFGSMTGRIKADAYSFFAKAVANSALVQLGNPTPAQALVGLPAVVASSTYLSGGAKGGTSNAVYQAAVDALQNVKGNFLVPLFSQDASLDITAGFTDSSSAYTIATVNAYAKTHSLAMSTLKRKKNRQAFCSVRDTYNNAKVGPAGAATLATFRASLAFEDVKDVGANGLQQFQPWMASVKAAAMQAAGFYRAIVNKGINISGALQNAADWKYTNDSQVEDALNAGLLPIWRRDDGTFAWVSDQTTYSRDNNFVFNSIQAVYTADVIALTTAQRMQQAFVGQSVADVSAALMLTALEGIMSDFLRLKLIATSDDAPKGFKNVSVRINGPTALVSVEIKLAGAIYFIPISFTVTQVTQSANS